MSSKPPKVGGRNAPPAVAPTTGVVGAVAEEIVEELTEITVRGHLEKHPEKFQKVLTALGFPPEIVTKLGGILLGEFARFLLLAIVAKTGTKSIAASAIANTIDDVIKGGVEAFAERARALIKGTVPGAPATPAGATPATSATPAAPAPAAAPAKPAIPDWDERVGALGRLYVRRFAASLTNTDLGNEVKTVEAKTWTEAARFSAYQELKNHADPAIKDEFAADGKFKPLTPRQMAALSAKLPLEEVEAIINLIFTAGQGDTTITTKVQTALNTVRDLIHKKTEASKPPAPPPPPNPWPRRIAIGVGIYLVVMVIIGTFLFMH